MHAAWLALPPLVAAALTQLRRADGFVGSDHYVHHAFITLIRRNRHRFIRERSYALIGREMGYPQLLHWILSFIPERWSKNLGSGVSTTFMALAIGLFEWFALHFCSVAGYPHNGVGLVFPAALIFATTPYFYDLVDPRSRGLSGRSFGLMLGSGYTYTLLLFLDSGSTSWLLASIAMALLVFHGSQFAWQFLKLTTPLIALLAGEWRLLLPPGAAIILSLTVLPEVTLLMLKREQGRRQHWLTHLVFLKILGRRPSVWRDFVYDFWLKGLALVRARALTDAADLISYIYYNPLVRLMLGFPLVAAWFVYAVSAMKAGSLVLAWPPDEPHSLLLCFVSASLLIVFATCFRALILLGRPERYMEFVAGITALSCMMLAANPTIMAVALTGGQLMILGIEYAGFGRLQHKEKLQRQQDIDSIQEAVKAIEIKYPEPPGIMSNNIQVARHLITADRRLLVDNESELTYGPLPLDIAFQGPDRLRPEAVARLAEVFNIDILVWDARGEEQVTPPPIKDRKLELKAKIRDMSVYELRPAGAERTVNPA